MKNEEKMEVKKNKYKKAKKDACDGTKWRGVVTAMNGHTKSCQWNGKELGSHLER